MSGYRKGLIPVVFVLLLVATALTNGCGGGGSKAQGLIPTTLKLVPTTASINFGGTLQFTPTARDQNGKVILTAVSYSSSDHRALNLNPNGLACAGVWNPNFTVCNPGRAGSVTVTAHAGAGITASATVYVHPRIDRIEIAAVTPGSPCLSQTQTQVFRASMFSNGVDITPEVGPPIWQVVDGNVAKTSTTGLPSNQVVVTANSPGATQVFAILSDVSSLTAPFTTCPIRSITLTGGLSTGDQLQLKTGGSGTIKANAIDVLGAPVSTSSISLFSSDPAIASVKSNTATGLTAGSAAITGVCLPPTCNTNLQPVYSNNVVTTTVQGTVKAANVYATTTACAALAGCTTHLVPIVTPGNTLGTSITLPAPPNSFVFLPNGSKAYLGSRSGLIQLDAAGGAVSLAASIPGKVLAVSPDSSLVVVSDLVRHPNLVTIFSSANNSSAQLLLSGVAAAAFSPDSQKLFLTGASNLYVFSTTHALQTIPLTAPASNVVLQGSGAFAFLGGGAPSAAAAYATCDNSLADTVPLTNTPAALAAVPNGTQLLALEPPGIQPISLNVAPAGPPGTLTVCPPSVTHMVGNFTNLGQGNFTPRQFILARDSSTAFVLSDLPSVLAYSIPTQQITAIPLANGASALSGGLAASGLSLFVGGSDGNVHRVNTSSKVDDVQVAVKVCKGTTATCLPDLVAVQP
jgi:hypothetical protein